MSNSVTVKTSPYGSWHSPITADLITSSSIAIGGVFIYEAETYWLEGRPLEQGRSVIVYRNPDGTTTDVTPPPFNVRSRVHEYGGGSFTVHDHVVYFVNFADQRLYRVVRGETPVAVTPDSPLRYADFQIDQLGEWAIAVIEDHSQPGEEAENYLGRIDLSAGTVEKLVSGNDFYSSPRTNHQGDRVAWLTWNHPNMPWDDVALWVGDLTPEGEIKNGVHVAGGSDESIMQPQWSPDGTLYFISDRSNWWNLYKWQGQAPVLLTGMEAEFGFPNWVFGMSSYGFAGNDRIIAAATRDGSWQMFSIDTSNGAWETIETPYTNISGLKVSNNRTVFTGGSSSRVNQVVELDNRTQELRTLKISSELVLDQGYLSTPDAIEFPTENGLTAHGFYYPPRNKDFKALDGEKPPLIVFSHGGPTGATSSSFNLGIQFWTSRGFAIVDVNYGGSTGYGREYRQRLYGQWGIVDVDDCVNAARYLASRGLADEKRLAIRGGSAGGYTTLAALTFRDVFRAGASYFGVSDLTALAKETHKFESRYLDQVVGPYPAREDLYEARSPIKHVDRLSTPVIFLQGLEDKVVPPNQAEMMVAALRLKGVPVAYVPFEGEQHGFRKASNIKRALEAEYYFYAKMFGFETADDIEPVEIENFLVGKDDA